jgi:5-methylcytosine-specific restriction endonuclease McrA
MKVKSLSNPELLERFNKLVRTERKITHLVLECVAEIDRRQLYTQKAYSSLFDYLVNEVGYSPSAANRRIASARLLREVPEMAEKIETGALNLSQLSKVQQAIRAVQKNENRKMEVAEKRELLSKIENTSQQKTELILAQELNLPVEAIEKTKQHRAESVTLTVTLSKEQMKLLKKVGDLISHAVPEKKWAMVLTYLAQKEMDRRTKVPPKLKQQAMTENTTSVAEVKTMKKRPNIPAPLRKSLLHPNAKCEFKNSEGKLCQSTRFLQIDHIKSVSRGGGNELENLQVLCGVHNRHKFFASSE